MGIWVLFFWLYRDYRLDKFREELFSLRDELFDLAVDKKISFESPAYGMLRSTINGTIQFGHHLGLLNVVALLWAKRKKSTTESSFTQRWRATITEVDPESRKKLLSIHFRLHFIVFEQVVLTSFILMFSVVSVVVFFVLKMAFENVINQLLSIKWFDSIFSSLDESAVSAAR